MDLRITGIRYKNIREFRDLEIDFMQTESSPYHISLVQMPNGTGKTTTMDLIRTVLVGRDLDKNPEDGITVSSLEPREFDAVEGWFEADFESQGDKFTFRLELDYETYNHEYRTIRPSEVSGGSILGHSLPSQLQTVVDESFANLFVFNGELTDDFVKTGKDEAENALKIVNYLNRLEEQKHKITEEVQEEQRKENVTTESGFNNIKGRLKSVRSKLEELNDRKDTLDREINEHKQRISELQDKREKILAENKEQLEKYKTLSEDIQDFQSEIEKETNALLDLMRSPNRLHNKFNNDMKDLIENMDIMELPKPTSQEFFTELSKRPECVCGREIDDEHAEIILENADQYLSEDDIGVLNLLKEELRSISDFTAYEDKFYDIEAKWEELEEKKQQKARVGLDDDDLNRQLQEINNELQEEKNYRETKQNELNELTTQNKNEREQLGLSWKDNIHLCRQRKNTLEKKLRQASNTVSFGKKGDLLEEIFNDFINDYLSKLKQKQIHETNRRLQQILRLSDVKIEDIDNSIQIEDREDVSEGQRLSVAYAYLSTLFEDSAVDVPFIIDSPAVSIDYDKRAEVAPIISNLFNQLVVFLIPSERQHFVSELKSEDIKYCTVHKTERPGEVEKKLDQSYFMNFQSDTEIEEVA